ncbi:MAG: hypothetical protein KUL78_11175 [Flavobacterium sp.]|nr:hypothetical protein [Flavobacterium sp.]
MGRPTKIEVNKLSADNYEIICIDELTGSATSINMPKNGYDALAAYFGKEALGKSSDENSDLHKHVVNARFSDFDEEEEDYEEEEPDYKECMCCGNVQQSGMSCDKCAGPTRDRFL